MAVCQSSPEEFSVAKGPAPKLLVHLLAYPEELGAVQDEDLKGLLKTLQNVSSSHNKH